MSLEDFREEIDRINHDLAELIAERMEVVQEVGEYKKENNMEIKDEGREKVVKDQFADIFEENDLPPERGRLFAGLLIEMAIDEELEVKEG